MRALFARHGMPSVAAPGFEAPGVVVSYTDDQDIHTGSKFIAQGLQTAAGVPLQCDEPADFKTFRVGLFGLDKLGNVPRTVGNLERALSNRSCAPALEAPLQPTDEVAQHDNVTSLPAPSSRFTRDPGGARSASRTAGSGICAHG